MAGSLGLVFLLTYIGLRGGKELHATYYESLKHVKLILMYYHLLHFNIIYRVALALEAKSSRVSEIFALGVA